MELITLITATTFSGKGIPSTFNRLWIGQEEVPIAGRSLSQCLAEMYQQGWTLTKARAKPDDQGTLCEYDFQRPRAVPTR
jgi:hypothetical protein